MGMLAIANSLAGAWKFVRGNWHFLALGVLSIALLLSRSETRHWKKKAENCEQLRKADLANFAAATAEAKAKALEQARAKEARNAQIAKEKQDELQAKLVGARARAADYVERMRHAANGLRPTGQADMPSTSNATADPAGAGENTIISTADLQICAENTVKLQGWADWYTATVAPDQQQ